jgi:hypothetical protein
VVVEEVALSELVERATGIGVDIRPFPLSFCFPLLSSSSSLSSTSITSIASPFPSPASPPTDILNTGLSVSNKLVGGGAVGVKK